MKHLLNNLTEQEKSEILAQHTGGKKIMIENFNKLIKHKSGDVRTLVNEQNKDPFAEPQPGVKPGNPPAQPAQKAGTPPPQTAPQKSFNPPQTAAKPQTAPQQSQMEEQIDDEEDMFDDDFSKEMYEESEHEVSEGGLYMSPAKVAYLKGYEDGEKGNPFDDSFLKEM